MNDTELNKYSMPKKWLIRYVIGMGILWSVLWLGAVGYVMVTKPPGDYLSVLMLIGFTFVIPLVLGLVTTTLNDRRSSKA